MNKQEALSEDEDGESKPKVEKRNPNPNILKLFYGSNTILREKEFRILINLQRRKNTYIYSSVRAKRKQS